MSGLQRAAARVRYVIGAAVGASLMVSQVHPDAIGAQAIHGRLVRMDPLAPDVCVWPAAVQWAEQAGRQGRRASTLPLDDQTKIFAGPPARKVQDRYAAFAAVSVDPVRDEVILTDENLFQVLAYNRLDNTARGRDHGAQARARPGQHADRVRVGRPRRPRVRRHLRPEQRHRRYAGGVQARQRGRCRADQAPSRRRTAPSVSRSTTGATRCS